MGTIATHACSLSQALLDSEQPAQLSMANLSIETCLKRCPFPLILLLSKMAFKARWLMCFYEVEGGTSSSYFGF